MLLLSANKVSKNFGYGSILKDVSFSLSSGEILSIVGPNGCGKSTLIKIIAGVEKCDNGSISIKKNTRVSYLKQVQEENDNRTVYEYLKDAFDDLYKLEQLIRKYESLISDPENADYEKNLKRYCELIEEFGNKGGYEMDSKINEVCNGLKISSQMLSQPFSSLSGGEKTVMQLARCLLQNSELFLLDEPTNHLDIERIEWLENYLKKYNGAIVIVSHDRYFLDKMSTKILDLSDEEAKVYNMNYSSYLETKEKEFEKQMSNYKLQQIQIKKLEQEISYFLQKADQTKSSAMYDRAKQLKARVQKIKEYGVKKPKKPKKLNINFVEDNNMSKTVFDIQDLTVYKDDGSMILDHVSANIIYGDRVALIGANGSGKSTFINTILNRQQLKYEGKIVIGPSTKIGYLPQFIKFDNPDLKVISYFQMEAGKDFETSMRILNRYHFYQDNVNKKIGSLSEGEKIRLVLAILLQKSVNCIIFDEPTNHIDIDTKEVLEESIEEYDGTFIFVSHDRYFINKFANKTFEFKDGKMTLFYGNYDYYREKKNELEGAAKSPGKISK